MTLWRILRPWLISFVIGETVAVPLVLILDRVLPRTTATVVGNVVTINLGVHESLPLIALLVGAAFTLAARMLFDRWFD